MTAPSNSILRRKPALAARLNTRAARVNRFQRAYNRTCATLAGWGIPFWRDPRCEIFYDDSAVGSEKRPAISYHWAGEIVICRDHVQESLRDTQLTLVHELTHYWCEQFPDAMRRAHTFRVPRLQAGASPAILLSRVQDPYREDYVGAYSQVDSEECLAEFMAQQVVLSPDLRSIRSTAARRRFRACREMLTRLKQVYRARPLGN